MQLEPITDIQKIEASAWDRLNQSANPFLSHAFLSALEESGSVGAQTGWDICHLALYDDDKILCGAMPAYLKSHSYGEYVFDHSWAHGFERAGGQYYPKLLSAVPFTPVPGPRLLTQDNDSHAKAALIEGMRQFTDKLSLSSAHINFIEEADKASLEQAGWHIRRGVQFHWHNQDYTDFDDFLAQLSSRKRKNIRKERASLSQHGLQFHKLHGDDIKSHHWDAFYGFYLSTIDKKWGGAYLNRAFFEGIGQKMADQILLIMAEKDGQLIAGALNFMNDECLFGRNWGCQEELPNLHFETCYYQAIEFAIEAKLARVEAGAQGMHKVQRGYLPVYTYSAHHISHEGFSDAVGRFLAMENKAVKEEAAEIATLSPYKEA